MRRLVKIFLWLLLVNILVPMLLVGVVLISLNTGAGRQFAERKINKLAAGQIAITGLGGHFPADIKIATLEVTDKNGVWLHGNNVELRWLPLALLQRDLHVTALSAASIDVMRAPVATGPAQKSSSTSLPKFHLAVDRIEIPSLRIGAALAGQDMTFNVTASAHARNITQADTTLNAEAAGGRGSYRLLAAMDGKSVNIVLDVSEPPDGLLGHFAGPKVAVPLALHVALNGPRDDAALNFTAALGAAQLNGAGTLGLNPDAPKADVILTVPALAPFAAIASQNIAGNTVLHLVAATHGGGTDLALDGQLALSRAPGPAARLVGPDGRIALRAHLANNNADIQNFSASGAGFSAQATGQVGRQNINLTTRLALNDVAMLSPGIAGGVAETGTIAGSPKDFAVQAKLTGNISKQAMPTGPFTLLLNMAHLPSAPSGTLNASGAFENSPLMLDAQFARDTAGAAMVQISKASWRSLEAQADLALAAGASLPTGTATFAVKRLADFRAFSPMPISGSITGDFAHRNAQDFSLNLAAKQLVVSPALGAVNGKVTASGTMNALAVRLNATLASLMKFPARIAAAGVVDVNARSASVSSLTAAWHGLYAMLQGPASVETRPGITVRHLAMGLNGGRIALDGIVSPALNFKASVSDMPVALAKLFVPSFAGTGMVSATAALTGKPAAPYGNVTFNASNVSLHAGPAAALPPANLAATATLAGQSANLRANLGVGPDASLTANGMLPLNATGGLDLHLTGRTDLRLIDPILAASGSTLRGVITPDVTVTGTPKVPVMNGTVMLADGSVQNVGSGLSLTKISARVLANGRLIDLQSLNATAGAGSISGHGTVDLGPPDFPIDLVLNAAKATPVTSDLITETIDAALKLQGSLRGSLALGGTVTIDKADINIPKSLPPTVVNLPILNRGAPPPPPAPPPPNVALALSVSAANQIFIRGDGLFAELGGKLSLSGTAANPVPQGGFTLIRGYFALGGRNLQFTKGVVSFNGAGFIPTLDLEASSTSGSTIATLVIGGTAAKPTITLTSSPPLPSDEVLAQLLFGQGTQNLSAFQAASLAVALAQLAGVGGGGPDPLGAVRNALGLDELSLGGGQNGGAPSLQAGRYVAPGVYVGAQQSTTGQGTQATVEVNLYKGLKLTTGTGTSSVSGGTSSSVGLTYQFNY